MLINNMDDLKENLLELRGFYYSMASEYYKKHPDDENELPPEVVYEQGRLAGSLGIIDTLLLAAFGGVELMKIMEMSWEAQAIAGELDNEEEE